MHRQTRGGTIQKALRGRETCRTEHGIRVLRHLLDSRCPQGIQDEEECPRQGDLAGPLCRVEVDEPWRAALAGIERHSHLQLLYWMHLARRDLVLQNPRGEGATFGTFALRSPLRPNPVASSLVALEGIEGGTLLVRGLDCVDATPLIDIKPQDCPKA